MARAHEHERVVSLVVRFKNDLFLQVIILARPARLAVQRSGNKLLSVVSTVLVCAVRIQKVRARIAASQVATMTASSDTSVTCTWQCFCGEDLTIDSLGPARMSPKRSVWCVCL
jgi:hypothetical protein